MNKRKYTNRETIHFLVFDGFICFGMFRTRINYVCKMSVCNINIVTTLAQKLMDEILRNFTVDCFIT